MSIKILTLVLGPISTNCYIVGDDDSGDAIVIDPVDSADRILRAAADQGWTIREILATHGHFDHIMASAPLKEQTGAPFRYHQKDEPLVTMLPLHTKFWMGIDGPAAAEADSFVTEGDTIRVGPIALDVLFTPGHSPGHVSFVLRSERTVFSGDVLFRQGIGRTDIPGADFDTLMRSIRDKLLPLGDDFAVMPGHMEATTIGYERQHNPYVVDYLESQT